MEDKYDLEVCILKDSLGLEEKDSYLMLKNLIKKTKYDKNFLLHCSKYLNVFINLIDSMQDLSFIRDIDEKVIKRLSELSLLIGIIRNISSLSEECRRTISKSSVFLNLEKLVYNRKNDENIGILNIISFEIARINPESHLALASYLHNFNCELFLFPCRLLQLLANLAVDSCSEYQVSLIDIMKLKATINSHSGCHI
ncbi:hypothetical protein RS030_152284 [Cryptosporidium xiaoi]|uniref:Uncharacterized protein n=1 Tax=Cryptosporidium xiaoi TaxID=659607 RepID=A0AAV9Y1I1_9CRYT